MAENPLDAMIVMQRHSVDVVFVSNIVASINNGPTSAWKHRPGKCIENQWREKRRDSTRT
jgi:hypothetical protein